MTDERLTGLALVYIHPEIKIDFETVFDRFAVQPVQLFSKDADEKV